jgi:hypothetical protein
MPVNESTVPSGARKLAARRIPMIPETAEIGDGKKHENGKP